MAGMTENEIMRLADKIAIYADDDIDASRLGRLAHHWSTQLRALARTDHIEDKLGMVAAPYAMTRNDAGEYVDRLGWKHSDQFAEGWNACREATLAASPAPDHSAGVGGMVSAAKAVIQRWDSPLWREQTSTAALINDLREAVNALAQPVTAGADGGK